MKFEERLKLVIFFLLFSILFIPGVITYGLMFPFVTGKAFLFSALIDIVFALYLVLIAYDHRYKPRFSWISALFLICILSTMLSGSLGIAPLSSFFGNFERMDSIIMLGHVFLYLVVLAHVFTSNKIWIRFFYVSVSAATLIALHGLYLGWQSSIPLRISGTMGNPSFLASYLLIHIFLIALLTSRTRQKLRLLFLSSSLLILIYALLLTGTRGAYLGLIAGMVTSGSYWFFSEKKHILGLLRGMFKKKYFQQRLLISLIAILIFCVYKPITLDTTSFTENPRFSSAYSRLIIWKAAKEGWQERPFLGYGMNNFNYVYNKHYDPVLYYESVWIDKVHNVVLEWLIAGGLLGLSCYLSVFGAALYYLLSKKYHLKFNERERAVLLGLITAYFIQNLFLFDTLVSYIAFIPVLAFIHWRVAIPAHQNLPHRCINKCVLGYAIMPCVLMIAGATIYGLTIKPLLAAHDAGKALNETSTLLRYEKMHQALERNSWANPEILMQLTGVLLSAINDQSISPQDKNFMLKRTQAELQQELKDYPLDVHLHFNLAVIARTAHDLQLAKETLITARHLSHKKQIIIIFQGLIEEELGDSQEANAFFKEAYLLDSHNMEALSLYKQSNNKLKQLRSA